MSQAGDVADKKKQFNTFVTLKRGEIIAAIKHVKEDCARASARLAKLIYEIEMGFWDSDTEDDTQMEFWDSDIEGDTQAGVFAWIRRCYQQTRKDLFEIPKAV